MLCKGIHLTDIIFNDACINGASMVIISERSSFKAVPRTVSVILVKNTQTALEALAHFYRMKFDIPVVAVTGSNGKTTTKNMIAALVASKLNVCATQKILIMKLDFR